MQIDHVVALSDSWQKGAQQLSYEQRLQFANDTLNLHATDGPTNQQKGDGDAATWLPPNVSYRCDYVARQISVKATYALWITQAEYDAMAGILSNCAGQLAPTNQTAPVLLTPARVPPPAPEPTPTPTPTPPPPPRGRSCRPTPVTPSIAETSVAGPMPRTGSIPTTRITVTWRSWTPSVTGSPARPSLDTPSLLVTNLSHLV
ncbi:HNH endonuclease family protein [Arthrobacter humicola]